MTFMQKQSIRQKDKNETRELTSICLSVSASTNIYFIFISEYFAEVRFTLL